MTTATTRYLTAARLLTEQCFKYNTDPLPQDYALLVSPVHKALREQVYILERLREEEFAAQFNPKSLPPGSPALDNAAPIGVLKALKNYAIWSRFPEDISVYLVFGSLSQAFLLTLQDCKKMRQKLGWKSGETLDG